MDTVELLTKVVGETRRVVDEVRPDQLGDPTPCADWTVRDLLNHLTAGSTMFAVSAEQGSVPDEVVAQLSGDTLGDDYKTAFATAAERAITAFNLPGLMEKQLTMPFGAMPAPVALNIAAFDLATHTVDLARATGQQVQADDLLEAALEIGRQIVTPEFRTPGVLGEEQPVADDAPVADRLLAFAGRAV